ncbi:MAG: OmpA family protein [Saprospiraceae bacterium]|nr:OmpA family protein [Saprospiraceae bacterium]
MKISYAFSFCCLLFFAACTYTQKVNNGTFAHDRKQYAVAVDLLKKEHQKTKTRAEKGKLAYLLADSYQELGKPASAADWYKKAYDDGYGPDALRDYAYALKEQEQYEDAIKAFKELGIEIGSPYEYKREITACQSAQAWKAEKSKAYSVTPLSFNSPGADYAPAIFKDGKIVYTSDRQAATGEKKYNWTGNEFSDLFVADVQSGDVQAFDIQLNTEVNEGTATFSKDRTELFFTRCYGDKKQDSYCRILYSKWDGSGWSAPVALAFQQAGINYGHPALSTDGKTLYFSCNSKDGWGGYDLWTSERQGELWSEPKLMGRSVNSLGNEKFPWLDGDTLYFSSDYHPGMGGLDIFKTYKVGTAWSPVQNLKPPINSGYDDFAYVIDYQAKRPQDVLQTGYFTTNRPQESGASDDLYRFERRIPPPEPPKPVVIDYKLKLDGFVLEKIFAEADNPDTKVLGRRPLNGATVEVKFGKETKKFTVKDDGYFNMDLAENTDYQFIAKKDGYLTGEAFFSTKGIAKDPNNPTQTFEVEVVLDKIFLNKEIVLEDIYYDYDKWDIRPDAMPTLNALVRNLELNPKIRIQLSSHTDCRGNDGYNAELSQRRAQSAVDYLVSKGISVERLSAMGFGESAPKANCACARCTEEEHQLNRRTTFTILEGL